MQIFEVSRRVENVLFTKYIIYILLVRLYYSPLLRRLKLPQFYIVSGFARCCTKNPEISSKFPLFQRKKSTSFDFSVILLVFFFCVSTRNESPLGNEDDFRLGSHPVNGVTLTVKKLKCDLDRVRIAQTESWEVGLRWSILTYIYLTSNSAT